MLKDKVLNLMVKANALAPFRFLNRAKTPILMYHRFSHDEEINTTSRQTLINHLKYLTKHYQVISLSELSRKLKTGESIPKKSAVITIDDGYRDSFEIAYPIFKEFKVPATLFVVTDFIDGKIWIWTDKARFILLNSTVETIHFEIGDKRIEAGLTDKKSRFEIAGKINLELKKLSTSERDSKINELAESLQVTIPELPTKDFEPLSWSEAIELDQNGVAIESHTVTHPILTKINDEDLKLELKKSREVLSEKLQREVKIFCYPNGNVGLRESEAAEKANYECAVTTEIRLLEKNEKHFLLPRIDAEPEMSRFVQATSGFDTFKSALR